MEDNCRLSVIVTTRNDGHGRDMLRRFQIFADGLIEQAVRYGLSGELVVVEWNPPPGPRLAEALELRHKSDRFLVRFIEVPAEIHRALPNSEAIPIFQMIAKNVGIRRARGRFLLATNPDLLFSDALIRFLASDDLDPRAMYRIDRTDVAAEVPDDVGVDAQLAWCRDHVLRVHTRWGSFPPRPLAALGRRGRRLLLQWWRGLWERVRRDAPEARRAALWRSVAAPPVAMLLRAVSTLSYLAVPKPKVHTNGCGDFTLLSREAWKELRGYPELPIWSMHLDSLLCYMAVASGYEQRILRAPAHMYHVEHGSSWVTMDMREKLRTFARKPWLDMGLLAELWMWMNQQGQPVVCNDGNWGFAREVFRETVYGGDPSELRVALAASA